MSIKLPSMRRFPLLWAQIKLQDYTDRPGLIQDTEHLLFIQHKLMGKNMKSYLMFSMFNLNSMSLVELEKFHLRLEGTG